jgi:hypothetical protein
MYFYECLFHPFLLLKYSNVRKVGPGSRIFGVRGSRIFGVRRNIFSERIYIWKHTLKILKQTQIYGSWICLEGSTYNFSYNFLKLFFETYLIVRKYLIHNNSVHKLDMKGLISNKE